MDTAAVNTGKDRKHIFDRDCMILAVGLLLMLLVLSRYLVNGEPVDVRSDEAQTGIGLPLYDGVEILQPLTLTEEMNWRQGYYALRFAQCDNSSEGQVIYTVRQGETEWTGSIALCDISAGEWTRLEKKAFDRLECGEAVLCLRTEGTAQGALAAAAGPDYYGFGAADYNGVKQDFTLAQAYHYHIVGMEYWIRLLCYGMMILCAVMLVLLVNSERIESRGKCLAAFGIMTAMFMAVIYLLDSSIYLEPTYAEAVTNFLKYAREESFINNLLITDAGYLPLLPRLITLLLVKVIRIPPAYALYFMQITACLVCSMIWSFFALHPFQGLMKLSNRILWCILVMLTCFCEETLFFTNHVYWGICFLLLMMIADLKKFPGWIYAALTAFGAVVCLSKGTYAVMLPLAFLGMIFMHRSMDRREKIFLCTAGAGALLQILYSFSGQGDGSRWLSVTSDGLIAYCLRLICRAFVEFSAGFLLPLGKYVKHIPILILLLTLVVIGFLTVGLVREVLLPFIRRETLDRSQRNFWLVVMYQMIVTAFFLVTVKPVPDSWAKMGNIAFRQMGHKYQIFSSLGFYLLLLTGSVLIRQRYAAADKRGRLQGFREACGRYGVLALMIVFCLTNPVMKLTGWAEAETSDRRVYAGNINAGWRDNKDRMHNEAFFIPVRGDNWGYSRNATIFQMGTDVYFEETTGVNLEERMPGYHSSYEIKDETQAKNLIGVMIRRPGRIKYADCRIRLLDAKRQVIAEAEQTGNGRYKMCFFAFEEPVNGVKTIEFVDADGNPIWYRDYIAWVSAW